MLSRLGILLLVSLSNAIDNQNFIGRQDLATTALTSAERLLSNDELQCLPRLLCEQLAGGKPGQLRGFQVDTQSLFTLLKYLGIDTALDNGGSAMLGVGQALLTGMANKGDPYACYKKYYKCPRDQARLLHYLNNHRGGFFRGFSRPYYGRSDSRIVNNNQNYDRPQIYSEDGLFNLHQANTENGDLNFIFPSRRPKSFSFQAATPTDRLPNRFQFPQYDYDNNLDFSSNHGNFFPLS